MKVDIFEFATATRIIFGNGQANSINNIASEVGTHALVVTGRDVSRNDTLLKQLTIPYITYPISNEPTIEVINQGKLEGIAHECDVVISIGGGSVIDAGKAIAALMSNDGDILEYLEVIGKGNKLMNDPLPFIAIPTTAGTGAEVTKNAVVSSPEHHVKVSLRDNRMLPTVAIIDPQLTYSMPQSITASTGMDALTQVLEPFVSHLANPITDALCREGLKRAGQSLHKVYENPTDKQAREDMALVSLLGGLALANAKLGAVHGFAGPLGGMFSAPHGEICATLLPHVIQTNILAIQTRQPDHPSLAKYEEVALLLTGQPDVDHLITWIQQISATFNIPGLAKHGIQEEDFSLIIEKSSQSSSMKGNPIQLTHDELESILQSAL